MSLCETLDRLLGRGAVIAGDLVISIAGVELIYVGLQVVVASVETVRGWSAAGGPPLVRARVATAMPVSDE